MTQEEEEHILAQAMYRYTNPSHPQCDPDFAKELEALCPRTSPADSNKEALLALGRRVTMADGALFRRFGAYMGPSSECYDPEFRKRYNLLYPAIANPQRRKSELLAMGRRAKVGDPLWSCLQAYLNKNLPIFDSEFAKLYNETYPPRGEWVAMGERRVLEFCRAHQRRPRRRCPEEAELRSRLDGGSPELRAAVEQLCPLDGQGRRSD